MVVGPEVVADLLVEAGSTGPGPGDSQGPPLHGAVAPVHHRSGGWLAGWLAGWLVGWLAGWLVS